MFGLGPWSVLLFKVLGSILPSGNLGGLVFFFLVTLGLGWASLVSYKKQFRKDIRIPIPIDQRWTKQVYALA